MGGEANSISARQTVNWYGEFHERVDAKDQDELALAAMVRRLGATGTVTGR
jgi:hypothetical protein